MTESLKRGTLAADTGHVAVTAQAEASAGARVRARVRGLSPAVSLGALVAAGFVVQVAVAWLRQTPLVFPDEYIYAELGRSIAATGHPLIRGGPAHFPSLLAPLLESPAWLIHDVGVAYRVVQTIQALSMSLAAVPAYLLARRVRLSTGAALAAAAVTLALPDCSYSAMIVAEAFAFPLVLAALVAGVAALERPTLRAQALFVVLALLATLARIQFVVLPLAYLAAAAGMGLRERRLRRALLEQRLLLGLAALGGAGIGVVGLGYYSGVVHLAFSPSAWLGPAGSNLLVFAYAAGFAIVPGGLLGYGFALARPRSRGELAFAALGVAFTLGIFAQAAVYGRNVHERYTFYAAPLLAIAFLLHAGRGFPRRLLLALAAAALVTVGTLEPLSVLGLDGETNSPVLVSIHWLSQNVGSQGTASLLVLSIAALLTIVTVALSHTPRAATAVGLAAAIGLGLTGYGLSADFFRHDAALVRRHDLPAERSWLDALRLGSVPLLQGFGGSRPSAFEQLFWNRSVDRVLLLPGAQPIDVFAAETIHVARDGSLSVAGRPLTGPLVVDRYGSTVALRGARVRATSQDYALWVPAGRPRLVSYFAGRYGDGWIAPWSRLDLWAARPGAVRLRVTLPQQPVAATVRIFVPGRPARRLRMAPGSTRTISLPVCVSGHWHAVLTFSSSGYVGQRNVSARVGRPRFVPGAAACPAR